MDKKLYIDSIKEALIIEAKLTDNNDDVIEYISEHLSDKDVLSLSLTGKHFTEGFFDDYMNNINTAIDRSEQITGNKLDDRQKTIVKGSVIGTHLFMISAITGAAFYAGSKIYSRYLSKYARQCASKSFSEKTACMKDAKRKAIQAQINEIKKDSSKCSKSKNPAKCKEVIERKIHVLNIKMKNV